MKLGLEFWYQIESRNRFWDPLHISRIPYKKIFKFQAADPSLLFNYLNFLEFFRGEDRFFELPLEFPVSEPMILKELISYWNSGPNPERCNQFWSDSSLQHLEKQFARDFFGFIFTITAPKTCDCMNISTSVLRLFIIVCEKCVSVHVFVIVLNVYKLFCFWCHCVSRFLFTVLHIH